VHGLLLRLSATDAEAEAAVRVIAAFDELVARRADVGGLLRSAAGLSGCRAGISDPGHEIDLCFGPDGRAVNGESSRPSVTSTRARFGDDGAAEVWLDRGEAPGHLDEIITERLAVAAGLVLDRMYGSSLFLADPAAVELLLSDTAPDVERARSARLLGLAHPATVRTLAIAYEATGRPLEVRSVATLASALRASGGVAHFARIGSLFAVVTTAALLPVSPPPNIRMGVGTEVAASEAPISWAGAQAALRFTSELGALKRSPIADASTLGPVLALAELPAKLLHTLPDVIAINRLAAESAGHDYIRTLDAFCRSGSLRRAAEELYLHHTSVAARISHAGHALGYNLTTAEGVFRATLSLTLWQLANSPASPPYGA
jgi:PucR C-terminal helix-turn-helix domain